jgi:hypothetical protein
MTLSNSAVIEKFVKGATTGRSHNIFIKGNVLYDFGEHFPLLVRRPDGFLMNADKYSPTTSQHQSQCQNYATWLIPFSILSRLNLDYMIVKIIDQSKERWDLTGYSAFNPDTKKHHTISINEYKDFSKDAKVYCRKIEERRPAALIMQNPKNVKCYLSSMDNNNYFASELPHSVKTVKEGFDLLKPIEATGFEGIDYLRQGEWFFIPCDLVKPLKSSIKKGMEKVLSVTYAGYKQMHIKPVQFLKNRNKELTPHHYATEYSRMPTIKDHVIVRGTVRHTNHDHRMLKLGNGKQWYIAVESNHVMSVGVGRVD